MIRTVEINDVDQLGDNRLAWNALLAETHGASFFQTLDWLQCCMEHFGEHQQLRVLIVYSYDKPIGILPLVVIKEWTRIGWLRVLTYPLRDWGWFYGPIGPNPAACLTAAMRHISQTRRDWDMLDLRWIDNDRLDQGRSSRAMKAAGLTATSSVWNKTALVELAGTWDEYLATRTSKQRNNLRRSEKRVASLGKVHLERHRPGGVAVGDGEPRWDLYDTCVEVASKSWQSGVDTGTTICDESAAGFFRDTYELAARSGMADLCLLRVNEKPIAFAYNYVLDGNVLGIRFGFDQEFSHLNAGSAMCVHMFRDSCDRGDTSFDMGVGSLEVKRCWQTEIVQSYRLTHYPLASPRSQVLRLKHWWGNRPGSTHTLEHSGSLG